MSSTRNSEVASEKRPADLPLACLLEQVSEEIAALVWIAEDLQSLSGTLANPGKMTAEEARRLQRLDLLTQTLADLARATRHIATATPITLIDREDLACEITLHDLRARLLGSCLSDPECDDDRDDGTGTVALF